MTYAGRVESRFTVPSSPATTIAVTNNGGGPTVVTIAPGNYWLTDFLAYVQTALTAQRAPSAGAWSVSLSTGAAGTLQVTIAMSAGTFSITWTSTTLRDLLGFTADIATASSSTGAKQAKSVWGPDCPIDIDNGLLQAAPRVTDLRTSETPTGDVVGFVGNSKHVHRGVRWSHVPVTRTWEAMATLANASWEQWLRDTQLGQGLSWFTPSSAIRIYAHDGTVVGSALGVNGPATGWKITGLHSIEPKRAVQGWSGLWGIELPRIVSSG